MGDIWAKQAGLKGIHRHGSWTPVATGRVITEDKQHMEEMQNEFREVCILIGLDLSVQGNTRATKTFHQGEEVAVTTKLGNVHSKLKTPNTCSATSWWTWSIVLSLSI